MTGQRAGQGEKFLWGVTSVLWEKVIVLLAGLEALYQLHCKVHLLEQLK